VRDENSVASHTISPLQSARQNRAFSFSLKNPEKPLMREFVLIYEDCNAQTKDRLPVLTGYT
jgi:hypothetical protein